MLLSAKEDIISTPEFKQVKKTFVLLAFAQVLPWFAMVSASSDLKEMGDDVKP